MPTWITPSGLIANVTKGQSFSYSLLCNTAASGTFSLISGELPLGLEINGPLNNPQPSVPTVWGVTSTDANTGAYSFTVRATDISGISDSSFTINVLDPEPYFIYRNSNLGIFPDGKYMSTSIAPNTPTSLLGNITIISGTLPGNLSLNPSTGIINGIISPSVLYNTGPIYLNIQVGAPNVCGSANTKVFTFTAQYDANNTANYSMTIIRTDLF